MIPKEKALRLAQSYLDRLAFSEVESGDFFDRRIVIKDSVRHQDDGWLVFYNSERYIKNGDINYALAGNFPIFVDKNGKLFPTWQDYSQENSSETYIPLFDSPIKDS